MMILNLARGKSGWRVPLRLPATQEEIDGAYAKLDEIVDRKKPTRIASVISEVGFLDRYFRDWQPDSFSDLNALARKLGDMDPQQRRVFDGALCAECIEGLPDILRVASSLNDYIFINGVTTEKELGRFLVDSGYKSFPEDVKPYLDYNAIGVEYYCERGGAFTAYGYTLRRSSAEPVQADASAPINEEEYGKAALLELCGDQEVIDTIDGFMNWREFGLCMMEQNGAAQKAEPTPPMQTQSF